MKVLLIVFFLMMIVAIAFSSMFTISPVGDFVFCVMVGIFLCMCVDNDIFKM